MAQAAIAPLLGAVYDAAAAPERWPELLMLLGREFRCHFAGMVYSSADRSAFRGISVGVDREDHQSFLRRFHRGSPLRLAAPPRFAGQIVDLQSIMPRPEFERTDMYQAFFRPNDMGDGAGLTIWHSPVGSQTISLIRPWRAGPFDTHEHAVLQALTPHLRRAAAIARRLQGADLLVRSALAGLDAVDQPLLVLDATGRLVCGNAAGMALSAARDGLTVGPRGLSGATPSVSRRLEALIAAAAARPGASGALRLPRPSGAPPLVAIAMPFAGRDDFELPEHPAVLLSVTDPAYRGDLDPRLLGDLFGLTPAEAELARSLLGGEDLKAIAAASGRSVNTLRNLLARVTAKTETTRQSALIRVLDRLSKARMAN